MKHKILVSGHLTEDILSLLAKDCDVRANGKDRPMERADLLEAVAVLIGLFGISASTSSQVLARRGEFETAPIHFGFQRFRGSAVAPEQVEHVGNRDGRVVERERIRRGHAR